MPIGDGVITDPIPIQLLLPAKSADLQLGAGYRRAVMINHNVPLAELMRCHLRYWGYRVS